MKKDADPEDVRTAVAQLREQPGWKFFLEEHAARVDALLLRIADTKTTAHETEILKNVRARLLAELSPETLAQELIGRANNELKRLSR